ncbi:MAG: glycosyltransferase family 4 protein [Acidobacteria bacterium]|nr:glycosyltransferase family 4 protein [Acidobacteriota bacterium]
MTRIAVVSFRLGGTDGVSIEAAKWVSALGRLGHHVDTVAGSGVAHRLVPGLAADAASPPTYAQLHGALDGYDVVVVENLASLPLNVAAREVLYDVLADRNTIFRHHDLAWQREHLAHLEGPRDAPRWRHVTINELSRHELLARGIVATTIYNSFDCAPVPGRRDRTREKLLIDDELLVALPTRAIPRKNVAGALALCQQLDATLWIMGPAEDGYDDELETLVRESGVAVRRMLPPGTRMNDAYAAADLVVMSSTWEGFGNPVLESVTHRRPLALYPYPVAREIAAFGFDFFGLDDVASIGEFLRHPNAALLESNLEVARQYFNVTGLADRLHELLTRSFATVDN